jgi:hypothetical protein
MKKTFLFIMAILICLLATKANAQIDTISKTRQEVVLITAITTSGKDFIIDADFVQMLTGKAAIKAAKKAGEAEYDINKKKDTVWYVPNDYFIANESTKTRKLTITPATSISIIKEGTAELSKATAAQLKRSYEGRLYRLSIANNKVVKLIEIYTP